MLARSLLGISQRISKSKFFPKISRDLSRLAVQSVDFDRVSGNIEEFVGSFHSILKACKEPLDLRKGKQVHTQIFINGVDGDFFGTSLLGMYALCGSLSDCQNVFFGLGSWYTSHWNWMIRCFTMMGMFDCALLFYFKMVFVGLSPDRYTFPYVIKSCSKLSAVGLGRMIHDTISLIGLDTDLFIGSALIKMYVDSDCIHDAREVFDRMPERDCVLWNVMIDGYVRDGDREEAIALFGSMRRMETKPNYVSFSCILSVCASESMLRCGTQLHGLTIRCGLQLEASVANTLLAMYSKCRCLDDVRTLFDSMLRTDLVTWNGMISGYVQNGLVVKALDLFHQMQAAGFKPDSVTLTSFLPALSELSSLNQGKEIHGYVIRNCIDMDVFLKSTLVDIYFKSKDVSTARKVYDASGIIDVVVCSTMISGYVLNGMSHDALGMFRWLLEARLKPNAITLASVLPACACLTALRLGKEIHCYILKHAFEGRCYVASSLMDMYSKCGRIDLAHVIFTNMCDKDAVAWNSMISSFTQNGQPEEAMKLFHQMGVEGIKYDCVAISCALSACASLTALSCGKEIHGFVMRSTLRSDLFIESALIDAYAKCGDLDLARRVFDAMNEKNEVSWNSMMAAYGAHGLAEEASNLFQQMQEYGFNPDHITFLALISACAHAGQVEEGIRYFSYMNEDCGIEPRMEHYACMVDLFGRAGQLNEALEFIKQMPFKPDAGIWGALLGTCRVHRNVEIAELATRHLFELDPQNSGYYVLMSNINAVAGRWEGVKKVRSLMKDRKVQKSAGCSWIEINSISHMFIAADKSHPESHHIYFLLKNLIIELREAGYVPDPELTHPIPADSNMQAPN